MNSEAQKLKQLGNNAYKEKDFDTALEYYGEAIELDPKEITYYLNVAAVQISMNNWPECVMVCQRAIRIGQENGANPNLIAKGYARMGRGQKELGDLKMAKFCFEKALKENKMSEYEKSLTEIESALKCLQMKRGLCKLFEVKGKGKGYIALEDIEIGTLILKEKLQCLPKVDMMAELGILVRPGQVYKPRTTSFEDYFASIMNAFIRMSKNDQLEFLQLSNKWSDPNSIKSDDKDVYLAKKNFAKHHEEYRKSKGISDGLDKDLILKILCIFSSNLIDVVLTGVGLKISRFNHSCCPNAELSDNDFGEIEVRATSKILEGQEITILYNPHNLILENKKKRQALHLEQWGFVCSCQRCQEEDINRDDKASERFTRLQMDAESYQEKAQKHTSDAKKYLGFIEKAISCYKQMHDLAESKKVPKDFILNEMLKKCFDLEVKGYAFTKNLVFELGKKKFAGKMEYFKEECQKTAKITFEAVKIFKGQDSKLTREWEEKFHDFETWFLNNLESLE